MKKFIAILLAAMMLFSAVACVNNQNDEKPNNDQTTENTTASPNTDPVDEQVIIAPSAEEGTMGEILWNAFLEEVKANDQITVEELANTLISNSVIKFMGGVTPLEAAQEYFVGFDEYKIEGFESGAIYMPMIGSIPFVGYVFKLADGANVQEFIDNLKNNCNPSWNICVTADQTAAGAVDNFVFFVMCPKDTGNDEPDDNNEDAVIIDPTVEDGTLGAALWNDFVNELQNNPSTSMMDLAGYLVTSPVIKFMGSALPIEEGQEYFVGFNEYKIEGFESGAIYMPMIGSIPFVGYVFELADGTDVQGFLDNLTNNCNPSWNICVTADQTVAGAVGNVAFFLMCPANIDG